MTSAPEISTPQAQLVSRSVRRAGVRATRAPSVHNTQPWTLQLRPDGLDLRSDASRRLRVLDPRGRQMSISCGCALMNARVSLAGDGQRVSVSRFPDPTDSALLARIAVSPGDPDTALARLDSAIEQRHTNRRSFGDEPVPDEVVDALIAAAREESADLIPVRRLEHRLAVARLSQLADATENANPAYRAELRAWTSDDPRREDGVPASAVPHVTGEIADEIPIRDFDTHGNGWLPTRTSSNSGQCLMVLVTPGDSSLDWLRAGEALERVLLEITARGYAASPFTQVIEVVRTRAELIAALGLSSAPHLVLRVGRAPEAAPTRRRRLADVITETS